MPICFPSSATAYITMKNGDSTEALYNLKYLLSGFIEAVHSNPGEAPKLLSTASSSSTK